MIILKSNLILNVLGSYVSNKKSIKDFVDKFNLLSSFLSICDAPDFWQLILIHSDSFIFIITLFVLGNIIGWPFIFSIIKQPYTLKQKLANEYIILLVSVLNHGRLPTKFIFFTFTLGMFLGRRLILLLSVPYPNSILIIFFFPFLFFYLSFISIYGYFVLCVKYPKIFGKFLINFFEKNANKEILRLIQPCKKESPINKKKLAFKKWKSDTRLLQKRKRKKFNFKTRRYSTTRKVAALHGSVRGSLIALPATLVFGNVSAFLNSPTYPESLDAARHSMSNIEEFNSFDSFDSCESASNRKFMHHKSKSAKF